MQVTLCNFALIKVQSFKMHLAFCPFSIMIFNVNLTNFMHMAMGPLTHIPWEMPFMSAFVLAV